MTLEQIELNTSLLTTREVCQVLMDVALSEAPHH